MQAWSWSAGVFSFPFVQFFFHAFVCARNGNCQSSYGTYADRLDDNTDACATSPANTACSRICSTTSAVGAQAPPALFTLTATSRDASEVAYHHRHHNDCNRAPMQVCKALLVSHPPHSHDMQNIVISNANSSDTFIFFPPAPP